MSSGDQVGVAHRKRRHGQTAGIALFVLLLAFITWRGLAAIGGPNGLADHLGPWAPLTLIPAHVVLSATPFPSEVLGVAYGSIYGLWWGTLYGSLGWFGGAMLQYTLVRRGIQHVDPEAIQARLPSRLRRFPIGHPAVLILGRQLPFMFLIVNVLAALTGVSVRRQIISAAISNVIFAFLTSATGVGLLATGWFGN